MLGRFPFTRQIDVNDCGASCLHMLCRFYGKYTDIDDIRSRISAGKHGASVYDLICTAESLKLKCQSFSLSYNELYQEVPLPCIILWQNKHYVIVYKISSRHVYVADPQLGLLRYPIEEFQSGWCGIAGDAKESANNRGIVVACEPTVEFSEVLSKAKTTNNLEAWNYLLSYLKPYRLQLIQIVSIMFAVTVLSALVPMVTQSIVDSGIPRGDNNYINIMLIASISLGAGIALGSWLQQIVCLFFVLRAKISIVADYIARLFHMPVSFFESRSIGSILQRNYDFDRVESLLLGTIFNSILSIMLLLIFGTILFIYSTKLFWIYLAGSTIYILWVLCFWSVRKKMDINYYSYLAKNQSQWIEFITKITDIKAYNYGSNERKKWEKIQVGLFKTRVKLLNVDQLQNVGTSLVTSLRDALLIFVSAKCVIDGEMSFGMLAAVLYIIGQLRQPIDGIVNLIISMQFFLISFARITDVYKTKAENDEDKISSNELVLSTDSPLQLKNVFFKYTPGSPYALNNINISFPNGKMIALVGSSGSGKSTLIKILSRLYYPDSGNVCVGNTRVNSISADKWRSRIGVVTQESTLVNDTILNNIVFGREQDSQKLLDAVRVANIQWEIESMPSGYDTLIGEKGMGVSEGQKQRILLARALYDSPDYMFLDELTSSLDARNEDAIVNSLKDSVYGQKTIIIAAHRLSTIMKADLIVVMKSGMIVDAGTHEVMLARKKEYYNIFKSQITDEEY